MSLDTNMSITLENCCDCIILVDDQDDFQMVALTIFVCLLLCAMSFVLHFLFISYRGRVLLHPARRPARHVLHRRTLRYWPRTSPVVWNNNKPRYAFDNGQPMKLEAKQLPNDFSDMRDGGWIRYMVENETKY